MNLKYYLRKLRNRINFFIFLLLNLNKEKFTCPICRYSGPFRDVNPPTGLREHAKCPKCGALERHRLQYLVVNNMLRGINSSALKMLHFAPESFFKDFFLPLPSRINFVMTSLESHNFPSTTASIPLRKIFKGSFS